jgi:DNA-binding winged helix-turn-helix (wHTH) protein
MSLLPLAHQPRGARERRLRNGLGVSWVFPGGFLRLHFSEWTYDAESRQLLKGESPIHLTPKAFELLRALLEARPKALSKADIRDRLWPQTFVSEATLASVVSELRAALDDDPKAPRFIRTVHGHGYAFSGAAAKETPPTARPPSLRRYRGPVLGLAAAIALLAVIALVGPTRLRDGKGRRSNAGARARWPSFP